MNLQAFNWIIDFAQFIKFFLLKQRLNANQPRKDSHFEKFKGCPISFPSACQWGEHSNRFSARCGPAWDEKAWWPFIVASHLSPRLCSCLGTFCWYASDLALCRNWVHHLAPATTASVHAKKRAYNVQRSTVPRLHCPHIEQWAIVFFRSVYWLITLCLNTIGTFRHRCEGKGKGKFANQTRNSICGWKMHCRKGSQW